MSKEIKSPCISVCVLDENDVCEGCYRNVREITDWSGMDNDEKRVVMVAVGERYKALNKHLLL